MPVQRMKEFLDKNGIHYEVITHPRAYTAAAVGRLTHIPGREVAKVVVIRVNGELSLAVIPSSRHLDVEKLRSALAAKEVLLVCEREFANTFPDCELGAMPPFGTLYGMPVYVDEELAGDDEIAFNAGSHKELVRMAYDDFEQLEHPQVLRIATDVEDGSAVLERFAEYRSR